MEHIIASLSEMFIYSYTGSTILLTFIVLQYIIKSPKDWMKILITSFIGLFLGVVWMYAVEGTEVDKLIYSFTFSVAFYSMIIKQILKNLGVTYNNDKGVV